MTSAVKSRAWPEVRGVVVRLVGRGELVQDEPEGRQLVRVDAAAEGVVVVVHRDVREPVALVDDDLGLVAEVALDREPGQDAHQREVEDQVAGLAQVALLPRDPPAAVGVRPAHDAEVLLLQLRLGGTELVLHGGARGVVPAEVRRHARQVARRGRRRLAQHLEMLRGARQDAADQRDEQQQVDRGEPRRLVDGEELQVVQQRTDRLVLGDPVDDQRGVGVGTALRQQ